MRKKTAFLFFISLTLLLSATLLLQAQTTETQGTTESVNEMLKAYQLDQQKQQGQGDCAPGRFGQAGNRPG